MRQHACGGGAVCAGDAASIKPRGETTTLRVLTLNTDMQCDITVQTPNGHVEYEGDTRIDGVPGTSAPITINFLDTAGSVAPVCCRRAMCSMRLTGWT